MVVVPQWHVFSSSSHITVLWDNKKNCRLSIFPNSQMPNLTTLAVFAGSVLLTHKMLQRKQKIKVLPVKPKYSVSWSKIFHLSPRAKPSCVRMQCKCHPAEVDPDEGRFSTSFSGSRACSALGFLEPLFVHWTALMHDDCEYWCWNRKIAKTQFIQSWSFLVDGMKKLYIYLKRLLLGANFNIKFWKTKSALF